MVLCDRIVRQGLPVWYRAAISQRSVKHKTPDCPVQNWDTAGWPGNPFLAITTSSPLLFSTMTSYNLTWWERGSLVLPGMTVLRPVQSMVSTPGVDGGMRLLAGWWYLHTWPGTR